MSSTRNLALLARAPEPGRSKTRLIPRLGAQGACDFAEAALIDTLHIMSAIENCRRILFYTPKDAGSRLQSLLEQENLAGVWELQSQPDAPDLGGRLQAALEYMQPARGQASSPLVGGSSATFIGMDCLDLTTGLVQSSMKQVDTSPISAHMIPAHDGGYVLLTLPLMCESSRVFSQISWSTGRTGEMQVQRLHETGLTCRVGDTLSDVDEPKDLDWLWQSRSIWGKRFVKTMKYLEGMML